MISANQGYCDKKIINRQWTKIDKIAQNYLDTFLKFCPENAIYMGREELTGEYSDCSPDGVAALMQAVHPFASELEKLEFYFQCFRFLPITCSRLNFYVP